MKESSFEVPSSLGWSDVSLWGFKFTARLQEINTLRSADNQLHKCS